MGLGPQHAPKAEAEHSDLARGSGPILRGVPRHWQPLPRQGTRNPTPYAEFRVKGLGFRVQGLGFRASGSGLRVGVVNVRGIGLG